MVGRNLKGGLTKWVDPGACTDKSARATMFLTAIKTICDDGQRPLRRTHLNTRILPRQISPQRPQCGINTPSIAPSTYPQMGPSNLPSTSATRLQRVLNRTLNRTLARDHCVCIEIREDKHPGLLFVCLLSYWSFRLALEHYPLFRVHWHCIAHQSAHRLGQFGCGHHCLYITIAPLDFYELFSMISTLRACVV